MEIGLGFVLIALSTIVTILSHDDKALDLKGVIELSPLSALITGALLITAGAGMARVQRWPYALHIPLVLWLLIVGLSFV